MTANESGDDARSSSLSDVDEPMTDDQPQNGTLDSSAEASENDSEAVTERLERSPEKFRPRKDILLASGAVETPDGTPTRQLDGATNRHAASDVEGSLPGDGHAAVAVAPVTERPERPKSLPSPAGHRSTAAFKVPNPAELAGRKRKRSGVRTTSRSSSDDTDADEPLKKRTSSTRAEAEPCPVKMEETGAAERPQEVGALDDGEGHSAPRNGVGASPAREEAPMRPERSRKGRRKVGKHTRSRLKEMAANDDDDDDEDERGDAADVAHPDDPGTRPDEAEDLAVAGEDDDEMVAVAMAKNEEGLSKRHDAFDSLALIESQFSAFKDRLYHERVTQLTEQLMNLRSPVCTHPEYLAQMQCVDARRDEKTRLERRLFQYKLIALQNKAIAQRSQIHAQYLQAVRQVREEQLEKTGEQWYRIHRDRLQWEANVPEYIHRFPARRSQQIAQQTAQNKEVSMLSGIAKYIGFPTAPSMDGARFPDLADDLKSMGLR